MNETGEGDAAFSISMGLAFIGGYADASSYLLARTFTGHLTGNCVLAAVSTASGDWHLSLVRFLALPKDWSFGNRVATNPVNTRRNEGETDVHQYGTATDLNIPVNDEWRGLA